MKPLKVLLCLLMSLGGMFIVLAVLIVVIALLRPSVDWLDDQITYFQRQGKWWVMLFPSYIISFILYMWWNIKHSDK
jgi:hypothetical protein